MRRISFNALQNLIPRMIAKLPKGKPAPAFHVVAAAFSKKGNLLGIRMNNWRNWSFTATRKGTGLHAEAALIKEFGRRIDVIYVLRVGNKNDILPVHPCESCQNMAKKVGVQIIPVHLELGAD